jgi:hypothetical protein
MRREFMICILSVIVAITLFIASGCAYDTGLAGRIWLDPGHNQGIDPSLIDEYGMKVKEFYLDDGTRCVIVILHLNYEGGVGLSCDWE